MFGSVIRHYVDHDDALTVAAHDRIVRYTSSGPTLRTLLALTESGISITACGERVVHSLNEELARPLFELVGSGGAQPPPEPDWMARVGGTVPTRRADRVGGSRRQGVAHGHRRHRRAARGAALVLAIAPGSPAPRGVQAPAFAAFIVEQTSRATQRPVNPSLREVICGGRPLRA